LRAPGIILGFRWSIEHGCGSNNSDHKQEKSHCRPHTRRVLTVFDTKNLVGRVNLIQLKTTIIICLPAHTNGQMAWTKEQLRLRKV